MYYASGHRYCGMWDQSKLHGLGAYEFPNGERYVGECLLVKCHLGLALFLVFYVDFQPAFLLIISTQ